MRIQYSIYTHDIIFMILYKWYYNIIYIRTFRCIQVSLLRFQGSGLVILRRPLINDHCLIKPVTISNPGANEAGICMLKLRYGHKLDQKMWRGWRWLGFGHRVERCLLPVWGSFRLGFSWILFWGCFWIFWIWQRLMIDALKFGIKGHRRGDRRHEAASQCFGSCWAASRCFGSCWAASQFVGTGAAAENPSWEGKSESWAGLHSMFLYYVFGLSIDFDFQFERTRCLVPSLVPNCFWVFHLLPSCRPQGDASQRRPRGSSWASAGSRSGVSSWNESECSSSMRVAWHCDIADFILFLSLKVVICSVFVLPMIQCIWLSYHYNRWSWWRPSFWLVGAAVGISESWLSIWFVINRLEFKPTKGIDMGSYLCFFVIHNGP